MIELSKFLVTCRNPRIIESKNGKLISVACGRCPECANKKAIHYTSICNNACQEHKYTLFLTLKYDEINVPRMRIITKGDDCYCVDITKRPLKNGKFKKFSTYGKIINTFHRDNEFEQFYKKVDIESKLVKKLPFENLRWTNIKDLQNFFKRLRFHISKEIGSSISFFGVSEYGPRTFRPHFHALLFFDDSQLHPVLEKYIAKSWKFGNFRLESPRIKEGVANYVTSYINSFVSMPRYFTDKQVLPKATHSLFLGKSANKALRDIVYSNESFIFDRVQFYTSFGIRDYIPTSYFANLLFPKCYNHGSQTFENIVYLFKIYSILKKDFGDLNCSQLARQVMLYPKSYNRFLSLLDLDKLDLYHHSYTDGLFLKDIDDLDDKFLSWFNRIYSAIRTSKHVITWCNEVPLMAYSFVSDKYTYDEYINVIIGLFASYVNRFYKFRDFHLIKQQFIHQEQFIKEYPNVSLELFYNVTTLDFRKKFNDSPIIKSFIRTHDDCYNNKIKHKELNDLNNIFL